MIEPGVCGIGACCRNHMCDVGRTSSPFCNGFPARIDRESHTFLAEVLIELSDGWGSCLINEWMVDLANCSTSVDTRIAINREDLGEPGQGFSTSTKSISNGKRDRCNGTEHGSCTRHPNLRW